MTSPTLFTPTEMNAIKERLDGDYTDKHSVFANRVRPKLKELLAWSTPKNQKRIKKLLQYKRRMPNDDEEPKELREQNYEDFKKNIGY